MKKFIKWLFTPKQRVSTRFYNWLTEGEFED